ncbi:hypothetical protein VNO77_06221 [Canavalia gladiata]|uniref:Small ribosomal subunit protein uS15c n=1 Tax=Canavalia gladiata TaxID=3824 RepID=A0AAN9MBW8_CANGL
MALLFQHNLKTRTKSYTLTNPSLFHRLLSTSNSGGDGDGGDQAPPNSNSPFSSFFREAKGNLKQPSPSPSKARSPNFSFSASSASQHASSLDEIRKSLSLFRARTSANPPGGPSSSSSSPQQQISFQEIYNRNLQQKPGQPTARQQPGNFDAVRESLRNIGGGGKVGGRISSPSFRDALRPKPSVIGGTSALPESVFGKEMRERKEGEMKTVFMRTYKVEELGEKLRKLRPEGVGKDWFSLSELSERLVRLRDLEEKEASSNTQEERLYNDLRHCLMGLEETKDDKSKQASLQRLNILGEFGVTPTYSLEPPKEHLVEKYFHPDNMSSAEKLKIQLAKVREEFKMSESDCGSARVQVAQLTTKIKHLSAVLHKKDVHSRKGLLAMVQRRKRLLKYLRGTDWDSYCFVISKLGLRDNPDL